MKPNKTLSTAALRQFILDQPDDRKIDMGGNEVSSSEECGCIFIHFARSQKELFPSEEISCGSFGINDYMFDRDTFPFISRATKTVTCYADAKQILNLLPE